MSRIRLIGVALLAVFAFAAVSAGAAEAVEAPSWTVNGTRLGAGETRFITAHATASFVLAAGGNAVTCTKLEAKSGSVILGSAVGEPGTNDEVLVFTGCTVTGNGTPCTVTEPITTENLKSTLVEDSTGKKLLVLFQPASGVVFVELKFTGAGCKVLSTKVTGSVLTQVLTDPGEAAVELGGEKTEATSWFLKSLVPQPTKVTTYKAGVESKTTPKVLEAFGVEATFEGTALVSLVSGQKWSPLP